jgi:hypothetical protein
MRIAKLFHTGQSGTLLIELVIALAISGLIGLVVTMVNAQIINQTSENNNFTTGSRHTLNALHWISTDVQMAQTIEGVDGFPQTENLVLTWVTWDNITYTANYSLADGRLTRSYTFGSAEPQYTLVAEYINPDENMTYCTSDNGVLTLTITSSVGEGAKKVDVTKVREITSRPNL